MEGVNTYTLAFSAQPFWQYLQDKGQAATGKKAIPLRTPMKPSQSQEPCGSYHGVMIVSGWTVGNKTDYLVLFFQG